jgi:predicted alpha/beta-fold hydrolase
MRLFGFAFKLVKFSLRIVALVALAFVLSIPLTFLWLMVRYEDMKKRIPPARDPVATEGRTMDEVFEKMEKVPFEPPTPLLLGFARAGLNNSFLLLLNSVRATSARAYPYPGEFEQVVFESLDGTPLVGALGVHPDGPRPGLVLSHGFMGSKNDHYIIDMALTAFAEWGFNVLAVDLRNFGRSQSLGHSPTTAGWKEAEDLLAASRYLASMPGTTTVGVIGFSMGAGSVMNAAGMAKEHPYITGGAVAVNGYADAKRMVEYISTRPPVTDQFYGAHLSFKLMHKLRREDMKRYIEDPEWLELISRPFSEADFTDYVEVIAAPSYGVSAEEMYRLASPRESIADVGVPLLMLHAMDDPVCPPSEMDELAGLIEDNPNVKIWMMPVGSHCAFRYFDRDWFYTTMRQFFSYWAGWEDD